MASGNERVQKSGPPERRHRRSECLADALRLQLEACREHDGLAAIVVSDELGFCVAHSGGDDSYEEIAARLPMLADPVRRRSLDDAGDALAVTTFSIAGDRLHACAVGHPHSAAARSAALDRVAAGFTRLLAR